MKKHAKNAATFVLAFFLNYPDRRARDVVSQQRGEL